ncbi:MAG: transcription termination/antitermination protein NusA [Anaerolineae bacterium]|nr:transcription termination/antitermination protein NusA [Anaerolineae bacterium]
MKSDFLLAFNQVCSDRGLSRDVVLEALEAALVSAYSRSIGEDAPPNISAKIDLDTGVAHVFVEKQVVEEVADPMLEIPLEEARKLRAGAKLGDTLLIDDTPQDFGRIAAQNAKQIILQRIREAEREARYAHYVQQEGEIVHGTVQSIKPQAVTLHLEGTEAILPRSQQVPGERYSVHQRLRAYVLEVRKTGRGPQIVVSRSHKNMLRRLLELEVPEIFNGAVEIKAISREAGSRSKVAVAARQAGVDPVGACVGMRGVRIQSIVNELGGEKIDVIEWSPEPSTFIAKALSPAKVLSVQLEEDPAEGKTANVSVPDDQLSLAIGRAGQNARLAAKLTGWRIDIQGVTEAATWALQQVNEDSNVLPALGPVAELLPSAASILRQHEQEILPYTSEELITMRQVIESVRGYYASLRNAERARRLEEELARRAAIEAAEAQRRETIEAALALIPPQARDVSLTEIGLSTRVLGHLQNADLGTVWDVLERSAEGDEGLLRLEGIGPKSLAEIKQCVDALELPETEAPPEEEVITEVAAPEVELAAVAVETVEEAEVEPELVVEAPKAVEEVLVEEPVAEPVAVEGIPEIVFDEEEIDILAGEKPQKKGRRKRELVYDEELGEVVVVRRRKRGEDAGELGDWEEIL